MSQYISLYAGFSNLHLTHEYVATQVTLIELVGGIIGIEDPHLDEMYRNQQEFNPNDRISEKMNRLMDYMLAVCSKINYHLRRSLFVSFYTLIAYLLEDYGISQKMDAIASWFEKFEYSSDDIRVSSFYIGFPNYLNSSAFKSYLESSVTTVDSYGSVKYRHEYILKNLLETTPDLELVDKRGMVIKE